MASPNLLAGPLLRYTWTDRESSTWHGSALIVTKGETAPTLTLVDQQERPIKGESLLTENGHAFWRFTLAVQMKDEELEVRYSIQGGDLQTELVGSFWVASKTMTMRILFHSCNGFEGPDAAKAFTGPALWNDVMRIHGEDKLPFHVMVGGGDQVYSDAVRMDGPLKAWANVNDPKKRARLPLTPKLDKEMDEWYFNNYTTWYSTEPFCRAVAAIPSCNIYDDHDIIDGYGSYPHKYQRAPIFMAIGRVAYKYYALFQLQMPVKGEDDPSWVVGPTRGPYIEEYSRSICTSFGPRTVFYGLDCRTERSLKTICSEGTYDAMFARLEKDVVKGETDHLLLLLGVPIFYPRMVFAEKLMTSRVMVGPLKKLNRAFGILGGAFNQADGSIELLDDLNDHWCAASHKKERNAFVTRLQGFSHKKQVRITILSGDVHLAAIGRTFSKERFEIPQNKDHRYMVNIVSSAITNAPPPAALANMLDRRNKIHHFDDNTDEDLMSIFHENADGANNVVNSTTMPARNYCIIVESAGLTEGNDPRLPHHEPDKQLPLDAGKLQKEGQEEVKDVTDAHPREHIEEDGRRKAGQDVTQTPATQEAFTAKTAPGTPIEADSGFGLTTQPTTSSPTQETPPAESTAGSSEPQNVSSGTAPPAESRTSNPTHEQPNNHTQDQATNPAHKESIDVTKPRTSHAAHDNGEDEKETDEKNKTRKEKRTKHVEETAEKLQAKDVEMQVKAQEAETPHGDMVPARQQEGGFHHASAAAPASGTRRPGALDISIRVEIDPKDSSGRTRPYGFLIPSLEA